MFHVATPAMHAVQLNFLSATLSETVWMCCPCRCFSEPKQRQAVSLRGCVTMRSGLSVAGGAYQTFRVLITLPLLGAQGMYLDPLAEIVAANGGLVYNASRYARLCDAVTMMVDVKQV